MPNESTRPMPGQTEFSADEVAKMKLAQDKRQIAPEASDYKQTMRMLSPDNSISSDDATDDQ